MSLERCRHSEKLFYWFLGADKLSKSSSTRGPSFTHCWCAFQIHHDTNITLSLILIPSWSGCTSSDDLHSLPVTAGNCMNQAAATVYCRLPHSRLSTTTWPELRSMYSTSASEHPTALVSESGIPCPISQARRSYTGRDRRSSPAELQMKAADAWSDENTLLDLGEPMALEDPIDTDSSEAPPSGSLKWSKHAFGDSLGMGEYYTFTITIDDLVVADRVESMDNNQKRLLVCQATKRDPHEIAIHSGTRWIKAVRQESLDTLRVYCYDLHERLLLQRAAILPQDLESIVNADIETFGVLMQNVRLLSLNLQPGVKNHAATQMLATANALSLPSLTNHRDLMSVRREKERKVSVGNLVVEFATRQQANKAIQNGLVWDDKSHKCIRLVDDSEVHKCSNCQRIGHTLSECTNETACEQCFGPHPSTDCLRRPQTCNCCGKMHSHGSVCSLHSAERRKAKAVIQSQQPLWPMVHGPNTSLPLRLGSQQSVAHSSPIPRPYPQVASRDSEQLKNPANVSPISTCGSTQSAGAAAASTRSNRPASIFPAPTYVEVQHASATVNPPQRGGTSGGSIPDRQPNSLDPEATKYSAILQELDHLRNVVHDQLPSSPAPLQSQASAPAQTQSKKRRATATPYIGNGEEPHSHGKRVRYTQSPTPRRVMEELDDPLKTYIRENGCVTVEAGEGLRNALERAGMTTEPPHHAKPPHRAKPWPHRHRSPIVDNSWYKWVPYPGQQPNTNLDAYQQPRDIEHAGNRSMMEQCGRGLPVSHQLPYPYHHYDDRSG